MTGPEGDRTVAASDFFQGVMTTSLEEDELLTSIDVPVSTSGQGSAYQKFAHPASRYAVVGVAAALTVTSGLCREASVSVGGVVPAPARASSVERALVGQALSAETISAAAQSVGDDLGDDADLLGDIFASAEYRKAVTHIWVQRAVASAAERAG